MAWRATAHLWLALTFARLASSVAAAGPPIGSLLDQRWAPLRVPLALVALLLVPGHALTTLLFPRRADLDPFHRLALAIGLSLTQVPLLALVLDRTPWGVSPPALVLSLFLTSALWCAVAAVRVSRLVRVEPDETFAPHLSVERSRWSGLTRIEGIVLATCGVLFGVVGWSMFAVLTQPALPPLTEFYVLGAGGLAQDYPRATAPGQPLSVTLGVKNLEQVPVEYRVSVRQDDRILEQIPPFRVEPGATWRQHVSFALPEYGFAQRVDFLLFRMDSPAPYRRLRLIVDVPQPGAPTPVRVFPTLVPRQ